MKSTAIVTAMIVMLAIGMTGSAMAAPAPAPYNYVKTTTDIDVSGTGSFSSTAFSPEMSDHFECDFNNANVYYDATVALYDNAWMPCGVRNRNVVDIYRKLDANGNSKSLGITAMDLENGDGQAVVMLRLNGTGNSCYTPTADLKQWIDLSSTDYYTGNCGGNYEVDVVNVQTDSGYMQSTGTVFGASLTAGLTDVVGNFTHAANVGYDGKYGSGRYDGTIYVYRAR